jgi:hypothetical protein
MARKRDEVIDDDGNILPPPPPDSPVGQLIYLLEYGRKRGFRIGPRVQVGDTIVEVLDIRQRKAVQDDSGDDNMDLVPGSDMATLLGGDT